MNRPSTLSALCALAAGAGLLVAGPLAPPAGPVSSTYKTLSEVEPRTAISAANTPGDASTTYRIAQPGSYYLTGNLQGTAGLHVITISASHVTLDLRGHTIAGGICGIVVGGQSQAGIIVRNGTFAGCSGLGVNLAGCNGGLIEDVVADHTASAGIHGGYSTIIRRCVAESCGYGFYAYANSCCEGCLASGCTNEGFYGDAATTFTRCSAQSCTGPGFLFNSTATATLDTCIADSNALQGFAAQGGVRFVNCRATRNQNQGFDLGTGSTADRCEAASNQREGFLAADDCVLTECTARANAYQGLHATGGTNSIVRCRALHNAATVAGIWAEGSRNILEENTSEFNGYGIWCDSTDNVITRNRCGGNVQDYHIAAGNELAPVVTNPGSNAYSTMTPWSNISH